MVARLGRCVPSLLLDAIVVLVLAFPEIGPYLETPILGAYAVLSFYVFRTLDQHNWMLWIVRDRRYRIAHGLEHATIAVLEEDGLPVVHGFTHGNNRFVVALQAGSYSPTAVLIAAQSAIRRLRDGNHALALHRGCGTSEAVSAATLWLVYVTGMLISLVTDGSTPIFIAVSALVFRFWLACQTSLGLLAQRLLTVSTEFTSARAVDIDEIARHGSWQRPDDERWFEVIVEIEVSASRGGLVAPGPF